MPSVSLLSLLASVIRFYLHVAVLLLCSANSRFTCFHVLPSSEVLYFGFLVPFPH